MIWKGYPPGTDRWLHEDFLLGRGERGPDRLSREHWGSEQISGERDHVLGLPIIE